METAITFIWLLASYPDYRAGITIIREFKTEARCQMAMREIEKAPTNRFVSAFCFRVPSE